MSLMNVINVFKTVENVNQLLVSITTTSYCLDNFLNRNTSIFKNCTGCMIFLQCYYNITTI